MGRTTSIKLKRVGGDVHLAPVKLDPHRPTTSGGPLKRCSHEMSLNFCPNSSLYNYNFPCRNFGKSKIRGSSQRSHLTPISDLTLSSIIPTKPDSEVTNSTKSSFSASAKFVVPNNSPVITATTARNSSSLVKAPSQNTIQVVHFHKKRQKPLQHRNTPSTRNAINADDYSIIGPNLSKFSSSTATHLSQSIPIPEPVATAVVSPYEDVMITTATTLDLPESQRGVTGGPSVWSMKNQVSTPRRPVASTVSIHTNDTAIMKPNTTTTIVSQAGDGDSESTPGRSGRTRLQDRVHNFTPPNVPPTSAATSISDKPGFMLKFRKPKPRPRSIITGNSVITSLPTTASTPNPVSSPAVHDNVREEGVLARRERNNYDAENNNNGNNVLIVQEGQEENNNEIKKSSDDDKGKTCSSKRCSKDKLPKYIFSMDKDVTEGKEIEVMPAAIDQTQLAEDAPLDVGAGVDFSAEMEPVAIADVYKHTMGEDESFWRSDTTEEDQPGHHRPKIDNASIAKDSQPVSGEGTEEVSSSSVQESSKSKSPYSTNPYGGYGYGSAGYPSNVPYLQTEKGAIRFHLPGRIQHKTTIKVAHFPTGDEKNVILNVKPDKEEEECDPTPLCANNQNFVVPPCPPQQYGPYGYQYGYGGYPYPNYYGYPPYY